MKNQLSKKQADNSHPTFSLFKFLTNETVRSYFFQTFVVLSLISLIIFIVINTSNNLSERGLSVRFGFLNEQSFFDINQRLISYSSTSTYGRALLVGLLNTLVIAILGILTATIIGFVAGILRLSNNWLISRTVTLYIEFTRNVPVLLQIIFWWITITSLPKYASSISFGELIFLNNRGFRIPSPILNDGIFWIFLSSVISILFVIFVAKWASKRRKLTGKSFPTFLVGIFIVIIFPLLVYNFLGQPLEWSIPEKTRFNFKGGFHLTPELIALWWALSTYTGAFISEIVRSGILSVSKGQIEAANSLGLKPKTTMRKIIIPQALRVIIPPLTSQHLNLTKNSSLAIAIGYQDLVSIGNTVLNQSGQAIAVVAIWMVVYLSLSLATSAFMNWYNQRIKFVE